MDFLFRHFWLLGFIILFANALFLYKKFKLKYEEFPELKKGYLKVIVWFSIVILGGIAIFAIVDLFLGLDIRSFNNKSIRYITSSYTIFWCILGIIWIHFMNGGDFLEKHPGIINVHFFG